MKIIAIFLFAAVIRDVHPNLIDVVLKIMKSKGEAIIDRTVINKPCSTDLKHFLGDLVRRKLWAVEMFDASGKFTSGILEGNVFIAGHFDQCLAVYEEKNDSVIEGQYCTVVLTPSKYYNNLTVLLDTVTAIDYIGINLQPHAQNILKLIKVTFGACLPATCSIGNLQTLWNYFEDAFSIPLHVTFSDEFCRSKNKPERPYPIDPYVVAGFGAYAFILLVATLYDVLIYQSIPVNGKHQGNYLTAFSVYTNARKLFSYTHNSQYVFALKCISGIKVLSMMWIIFGHRVVLNVFSPNVNSVYVFKWLQTIENSVILAASFAVDTFFALSGVLLSYVFFNTRHLVSKRGLPVLLIYGYRILRLFPALIAAILFYISIFKHLSNSPSWALISEKVAGSCHQFWWTTILFLTNYVPIQKQCIEQSWYLAVDSQLYWISPFILKSLLQRPKKTIIFCILMCIISIMYSYIVTIQNGYGAMYYEGDKGFFQYIYLSTFSRMPTWMIGILMGYATYKYQNISIPKSMSIMVWIFSLTTMSSIVLSHVLFTRNSYDAFRSAIFNSAARPVWALSITFIVFLCVTGHGGMIDTFLSLPIFQVLVRLTYSQFLVHLGLLLFLKGRQKIANYFSNLDMMHDFFGDYFFTFVIASVWCLAFETPFLNISNILMQKGLAAIAAKKAEAKNRGSSKKKGSKKNYLICVYNYENPKDKEE